MSSSRFEKGGKADMADRKDLFDELHKQQRRRHRKGEQLEGREEVKRLEGELTPDYYSSSESRRR